MARHGITKASFNSAHLTKVSVINIYWRLIIFYLRNIQCLTYGLEFSKFIVVVNSLTICANRGLSYLIINAA